MSGTGPTPIPEQTDGAALTIGELLARAEMYACSAGVLADQYQGSGSSAADFAVHQGVLHEATLSQAFTALAQARLHHAVVVEEQEERERDADPRAALREQAAQIQAELYNRAPGRYVR